MKQNNKPAAVQLATRVIDAGSAGRRHGVCPLTFYLLRKANEAMVWNSLTRVSRSHALIPQLRQLVPCQT